MTEPPQISARSLAWAGFMSARRRSQAKTKALKATRRPKRGLSRTQQRDVLEREMAVHGVPREAPWVESRLDILAATPLERLRQTWTATRSAIAGLGTSIPAPDARTGARRIQLPRDPLSSPDAFTPATDDWIVVDLDPVQTVVLDRVHADGEQTVSQIAMIRIALRWDAQSQSTDPQVIVCASPEELPLGAIHGDDAELFRSELLADEPRVVTGYLVRSPRREPPYMLTLHPPE
jgi:hypothetical protein